MSALWDLNRYVLIFLLFMLLSLATPSHVLADEAPHKSLIELLRINASQQERIDRLEKSIDALQQQLNEIRKDNKISATSSGFASTTTDTQVPIVQENRQKEQLKPVSSDVKPDIANVKSKYGINIYGYMKVDAITDDSSANQPGNLPGNFVLYVPSEAAKRNDSKFYLTANQSRIGFDFKGPEEKNTRISGRFEFDFYGGYLNAIAPETKTMPMLRHFYATVDWKNRDLSLLGGQTWDVISPLTPNMLSYGAAAAQGNLGFRRPQLRLTKGFRLSDQTKLTLQLAATRTVGKSDLFLGPNSTGDGGIDSGQPTSQGRIAISFPVRWGKMAEFGLSGHSGQEEYDYTADGRSFHVWSNSSNIDLKLPLMEKLSLQGEAFRGRNLDNYYGGIMQGLLISTKNKASGAIYRQVNTASGTSTNVDFLGVDSLESAGNWFELGIGPFQRWQFNLGRSNEHMQDDNLNSTDRTFNESRWINVMYALNSATQFGLEYSTFLTLYKNSSEGTSRRLHAAMIFRF
ncbi:MAG: hypothetical protein HQM09_01905 [Candidatus Riflebacteria bacterium]|nr:hypothetical protein [Candidatus Riflebacteria bacterium]